jgi:molybdate transport system substrate-binding protein
VDVVVLDDKETDELIKQGKLAGSARAFFAKSSVIGVAVRAGVPKPDIHSAESLKASILAARSVAYSAGASGSYMEGVFKTWGISEQVKAKAARVMPSEPVGQVVARGDAEIGFHQMSELLPVKGIDIVGPLPPEIQHVTVFSGGIPATTGVTDAAAALVKFLAASPPAVLRKHGLDLI